MAFTIQKPVLKKVTINGNPYELVAFYYPGKDTAWDKIYHGQFMGNFYLGPVTLTINGITGSFHNAEAAFQATKWWNNDIDRKKFENAKTGDEAFRIKKHLHHADGTYAGLGRDGAMKEVLKSKFSYPNFRDALLDTKDAYLLEHNSKLDRDYYWSDNLDGTGKNMLGITLMEVRELHGGSGIPKGTYTVKDFTDQVEV